METIGGVYPGILTSARWCLWGRVHDALYMSSWIFALPCRYTRGCMHIMDWNLMHDEPLTCVDQVISVWLGQYHGCWCPGFLRRQDISSHDIDYVEYVGPGLTWGRILRTCVILMWSNDIKCKYVFMFTLKSLARKELMFLCQSCMYCRTRFILKIQMYHDPWTSVFNFSELPILIHICYCASTFR